MATCRYAVEHETRYTYRVPVAQSWQLAHLTPRELPWQHLVSHRLLIEPGEDERRDELDAFGNGVTHFAVHAPHPQLRVRMLAQVEIGERPDAASAPSPSWETVRDSLRRDPTQAGLVPARMSEQSALVAWSESARAYALPSFAGGRGWLEAVADLMHRIHADFKFDAEATTVTTQVDEVLELRRGVCQDFAHLMLACLRGHGLPARYVSGYLLTDPPPGRPRLLGADASHAWVAAWSPAHGWVEFDPTNDHLADQRYITLAWGSDFADVVPLRGVILGGRGQSMDVEVSVIPV
jgi:transglutaminase-like putative cysteine protease